MPSSFLCIAFCSRSVNFIRILRNIARFLRHPFTFTFVYIVFHSNTRNVVHTFHLDFQSQLLSGPLAEKLRTIRFPIRIGRKTYKLAKWFCFEQPMQVYWSIESKECGNFNCTSCPAHSSVWWASQVYKTRKMPKNNEKKKKMKKSTEKKHNQKLRR